VKAYALLAARSDEILRRWRTAVQGTVVPESMSRIEMVDELPIFVREIVAALREDAGLPSDDPVPEDSATAAGHGEQRLALGFSLDAVVREYGALKDAIVATARDAGEELTARELDVIFDSIITGIAQAVSQYVQQRDVELMRQANEHFAFVAHELRNPLSSSLMALHLLKQTGRLATDGRLVGPLERGLQRASELVEQTLKTARIASGIELRRQAATLSSLFEDAEAGALAEAEAKGVKLQLKIENDRRIDVDVRLIRSALGNLMRNAVRYTASGCVELRGSILNNRAIIEVEDSCGGLPPGKVEQAFAPFVRLEKDQGGFGLGLAIAKQAVDAHGGSIRVQNLPGKGCIFVLELPLGSESP
jgi:signal transduction histidine kinase